MEFPQKELPTPTNKSFDKYPIVILNIAKMKSGNPIRKEDSCAFKRMFLLPFGSAKKTINSNRVE